MGDTKRILPNWLKVYLDWTLPRSEAPESMVLWAGLFTVAAVLKRKVIIPKSLMGSYEIYPNLYIIFVGTPGTVRKSTTIGYAEELLLSMSELLTDSSITFASTSSSASKFIEMLSKSEDSSMTVISSEFSSFVATSKETMYELLTDIYDGKKKFSHGTRQHGFELAEEPVINLIAATTPAWISKQPPEQFLGGGFASRVLFIFEQKRRQYKLYFDDIDYEKTEIVGGILAKDLRHISSLKGEFKHDSLTTKKMMEDWYQVHAKQGTNDSRIEGYWERKHVHVHKVAMILSVMERDDLIITQAHFEAAKLLLDELEEKMPRALSSIGSNPIGHYVYDVQDFIRDRGEVTKKVLTARFFRDLRTEELIELMDALEGMGTISILPNGKNPTYKFVK